MTRQWRPWNRARHPEQLADFVQTGVTRLLLPAPLAQRLPALGDGRPPQERARIVFDVLSDAGIRYVHEPSTSTANGQEIRPPDQVLARPKHGTCVDLAVLYAGACLDAGLRPIVLVVDSNTGRSAHAVVAVWLGGDWSLSCQDDAPLGGETLTEPPYLESGVSFVDAVRSTVGGAGTFVVVDVQMMARVGDAGPGTWDDAVSRGYDVAAATQSANESWRWSVGVDVGEARLQRAAFDLPVMLPADREVLGAPFADPVQDHSPLTQLKARTGMVPFLPRDELDTLIDWADPVSPTHDRAAATERPKVGVRVLTGVGGSGKTHLAAELCRRLSAKGWYAGFAPKHPTLSPDSLHWLTGVVSPVLVIVDYADDSATNDLVSLIKALSGRDHPTRVLLTARTDGPWYTAMTAALHRDSVIARGDLPLMLARLHRRPAMLFARTLQRFAVDGRVPEIGFTQVPQRTNWTTLDVVIQAWLAATGVSLDELPETRGRLYDEILLREFEYWQRAVTGALRTTPQGAVPAASERQDGSSDRGQFALVPTERLAQAGAALTLVAPDAEHVADVLERLGPAAVGEPSWGQLGEVLANLLVEQANGAAVRPDPIGEHLVLRVCRRLPSLVDAVLPHPPAALEEPATALRKAEFERRSVRADRELTRVVETVSRASQLDRSGASELAEECLAVRPAMWPQALDHALRDGGAFAGALEVLAKQTDSPLPLQSLAKLSPGHGALRGLALVALESTRPVLPESPDEDQRRRLAGWLNDYAVRLSDVGDRRGALAAIDEAVTHYRNLAETNPAAFLPDLAMSLNNQANQRSEVGDRTGALAAIDEAVTIRRNLAETNPAAFLPNLAMSLNNQATIRSEGGHPPAATKTFVAGWEGLSASVQSHLRMERVRWMLSHHASGDGADDLLLADCVEACRLATGTTEDARLVGSARRTIAGMVADLIGQRPDLADDLQSTLPAWALGEPGGEIVDLGDEWLGCESWAEREQFLTRYLDRLRDPTTREALRTLGFQQPELRGLAMLEQLLDDFDEHGVDQVLPVVRHHFTLIEELQEWLEMTTWRDSERFLTGHRQLLTDDEALSTLASLGDSPLIRQHLGLLTLAATVGVDTAYAARADADTAVSLGNELIESLRWPTISALLFAAPVIAERPFQLAYFLLLLDAVADHQGDDWAPDPDLLEHARRHATREQRALAESRLRRLVHDHSEVPSSLATLADTLAPADELPDDARRR